MLTALSIVALFAIAVAHLRCQSPDENSGYRFESAMTSAITIMVVGLVVWITAFTAGFTDGPKSINQHLYWLGGIGTAATIALLAWSLGREVRNLRQIVPFVSVFLPVALLSVGITWVPSNVATPVIQGLTALTAVLLCVLGLAMPQTPGQTFTGWLGAAAGMVVLITRRGNSVEETHAWQLVVGIGLMLSALMLLAINGIFRNHMTGQRLWPASRAALLGAGGLCGALAFWQLT